MILRRKTGDGQSKEANRGGVVRFGIESREPSCVAKIATNSMLSNYNARKNGQPKTYILLKRSLSMTTTTPEKVTAMTASHPSEREPVMLRRRIGSTEYVAKVTYSKTATETLEDKLLRLLESEVRKNA